MELTEKSQGSTPTTKTSGGTYVQAPGYFKRLTVVDWLFAAALLAGAVFGFNRYGHFMDVYEEAIMLLCAPVFAALGWHWKPVRWLMALVALLSLWAISMSAGQLDMGTQKFWLRYMISSQSAILWMSVMFCLSTLFYWIGFAGRSEA